MEYTIKFTGVKRDPLPNYRNLSLITFYLYNFVFTKPITKSNI